MVARGTYSPYSWLYKLHGHDDVLRLICGGLWLPQRPPREVIVLRQQVHFEYKSAYQRQQQLDAECVRSNTLERERDEATRRAAAAHAEARAARTREDAQHKESDARVEEARGMAAELKKEFDRKLAAAEWAHRKEMNTTTLEWQQQLQQHEAAAVGRLRNQDMEIRDEKQRIAAEREEARAEAAELTEQVEQLQLKLSQLQVSLERVREMSKGSLLQQVADLKDKVRELGARRTLNTSDANRMQTSPIGGHAWRKSRYTLLSHYTPTPPHPHPTPSHPPYPTPPRLLRRGRRLVSTASTTTRRSSG